MPTPNDTTLPPSGDENNGQHPGKRSAEERIDELIGQIKGGEEEKLQMRQEIEALKQRMPPPPPPPGGVNPDVQRAIDAIRGMGFIDEKKMEERIRAVEDRYALNAEHQRFENEFDGSDGRPKYDRNAVEKFMKERAIFDPQAAYKLMHESELLDWTLKEEEKKRNPDIHVETPGSMAGKSRWDDDSITKEKLAEVSNTPSPANREWYERNREKIFDMMAKGQL